ncbi:MAG TPA: isoaspartyl peptidase/L-asparaginase [Steroidobacteraceae bacterium]|jgi:isoaspartyl peptidase/L-asparaginase-like protein (Ntn-hydrolase superfamily)|nr:isoaspartyl peptidase/L-asparaginase [Steroidobacteraceae bacterium]
MYALAIHGGAGALSRPELARERDLRRGLTAALAAGERVLAADGSALDAVEAAVVVLEDAPLFNAGCGAVLTLDGTVELDAAIMSGTGLRAGAVAQVRHTKNPIRLARRVLEELPHVFLAGEGADAYAAEAGLAQVANDYFITALRREQLAALQPLPAGSQPGPGMGSGSVHTLGTVGAVARDRHGRLAAATSTGGTPGKRSGRVGDSPVIGAGTYADDASCAVSTTGDGEWFLRLVQAYDIAARLRYGGQDLARAVLEAIGERAPRLGARGGLIAIDHHGQIVMRHNTAAMLRGCVREGEQARIDID